MEKVLVPWIYSNLLSAHASKQGLVLKGIIGSLITLKLGRLVVTTVLVVLIVWVVVVGIISKSVDVRHFRI